MLFHSKPMTVLHIRHNKNQAMRLALELYSVRLPCSGRNHRAATESDPRENKSANMKWNWPHHAQPNQEQRHRVKAIFYATPKGRPSLAAFPSLVMTDDQRAMQSEQLRLQAWDLLM